MVTEAPRIPASADSLASKLAGDLNPHHKLIEAIDVGLLALDRVAAIFTAIDSLDLGVGGKRYDALCALRDIGAEIIEEAKSELRAIPTKGSAA